jgi:hypothetical protein
MKINNSVLSAILVVLLVIVLFGKYSSSAPEFFVENVGELPDSNRKQFILETEEGLRGHNSAILRTPYGYVMFTRVTNFTRCNFGNMVNMAVQFAKNIVVRNTCQDHRKEMLAITYLDQNLEKKKTVLLNTSKVCANVHDIRCFRFQNKIYLLGTLQDYGRGKVSQSIADADRLEWRALSFPEKAHLKIYKNWSPVVYNDTLYMVHTHNPLTIVKVDVESGVCSIFYEGEKNPKIFKDLRGNTPYVQISPTRFMSVTHRMTGNDVFGRHYLHYFCILEMSGTPRIVALSRPICFGGECGIEFVLGLTESFDGSYWVVSFGKNDCFTNVLAIKKATVLSMFDDENAMKNEI